MKRYLNYINEKKYENEYLDEVAAKNIINKFCSDFNVRETQGNAEYTIQIKAMKTPVNIKYFNDIQGVKEIIANDGYYKYIYGKYNKIDDARKALKKVKKKYPDAFIVNFEKYN